MQVLNIFSFDFVCFRGQQWHVVKVGPRPGDPRLQDPRFQDPGTPFKV